MNQNNISLEKVIKGLECCTKQSVECKSECPYYDSKKRLGTDCFDVLKADALALLKAQEPKQVKRDRQCEIAPNEWIRKGISLTLLKEQEKEISRWRERWQRQKDTIIGLLGQKPQPRLMTISDLYAYDMGFYESRDEGLVLPVLISRGGPDDDETVGFIRKDGYELRKDCGLMNITWRIWTACPSDELREETPWD